MDYIGNIPEDFDPLDPYNNSYQSTRDEEIDFAQRESLDGEPISRLNYKITRNHPK